MLILCGSLLKAEAHLLALRLALSVISGFKYWSLS